VRGAIDSLGDAHDDEAQLEHKPDYEGADEQRHDSRDQVDQSLRGRLLEAEDNTGNDGDAAAEDPNDVKKLYDAARELLLE
jgi:hypothetical protein